jgi:hypothetical protein
MGSCNLLLKLLFETGCADVSVSSEWAAVMLSAASHFPKTDNPFLPVSH